MSQVPITKKGFDKLQAELKKLKTEDRPKIIEDIATAREHGDLKENAEYHAAREQQGFIEGRIKELEATVSNANVIDVETLPQTGKVVFGTQVELLDVDSDEEVAYRIVGDIEADIKQNLIAVSSPLSRALIGKEEGEEITFEAPAGKRNYEILAVNYEA